MATGGALTELVSVGLCDQALTGSPTITFFRTVFRRYTNFAMEAHEITASSSSPASAEFMFDRIGDVVFFAYAKIVMPAHQAGYVANVGQRLIEKAELKIGGQVIDTLYSSWLVCWEALAGAPGKDISDMVGSDGQAEKTLYVPLPFFFTQSSGLALPLVSLQFHSVRCKLSLRSTTALTVDGAATASQPHVSLLLTYIFLDTEERRRFAEGAFEVLIQQHQEVTGGKAVANGDSVEFAHLSFSHCVEELVWCIESDAQATNFAIAATGETVEDIQILFNGNKREEESAGAYYRMVQPYQHHTKIPSERVYCYSFSLHPEEAAPSGSANFSRIDNVKFKCTAKADGTLRLMAQNYNVLRFRYGLGGLKFAN